MRELLELAERKQNQLQEAAARLQASKSQGDMSASSAASPGPSACTSALGGSASAAPGSAVVRLTSPSREASQSSDLAGPPAVLRSTSGSFAQAGQCLSPSASRTALVSRPLSPSPIAPSGAPAVALGALTPGISVSTRASGTFDVSSHRRVGSGCSVASTTTSVVPSVRGSTETSAVYSQGSAVVRSTTTGTLSQGQLGRPPFQTVPPSSPYGGMRSSLPQTGSLRIPVATRASTNGCISSPQVPVASAATAVAGRVSPQGTSRATPPPPQPPPQPPPPQQQQQQQQQQQPQPNNAGAIGATRPTTPSPMEVAAETAPTESDYPSSANASPTGLGKEKVGMGWNSQVKSLVEFQHMKRTCARARVYLYQAPFTPSVRYTNGAEHFVLPSGWALLRSRQGLLVWLELLDDILLQEFLIELASSSPPPKPTRSTAGLRTGSPSPSKKAPAQMTLSLPDVGGGLHGQVEIRCPRACPIDLAIRVPSEDVIVLRASGASGLGLRAAMGSGFDEVFKGWLSDWDTTV